MPATTNFALVIGADGGIGRAVCHALEKDPSIGGLVTVSRRPASPSHGKRLDHIQCDYSEAAIARLANSLAPYSGRFGRVVICNGRLHDKDIWPEKKLEELTAASLHALFLSNSIVPMLLLKMLMPLVKATDPCVIALLSARIGSIADNRLGGWYSYRISKAALNMGAKTAAVEYARRAKNVRFLLYHPGTVATPLSSPFQRSIPPGRLISPELSAARLLVAMNQRASSKPGEANFLDWQQQPIQW